MLPEGLGGVRSGSPTVCAQLWLVGGHPLSSEATEDLFPSWRCDQQRQSLARVTRNGWVGSLLPLTEARGWWLSRPLTRPCASPARPRIHPDHLPRHLPVPPARPDAEHLLLVPAGELPALQMGQGDEAEEPGGLQVCGAPKALLSRAPSGTLGPVPQPVGSWWWTDPVLVGDLVWSLESFVLGNLRLSAIP